MALSVEEGVVEEITPGEGPPPADAAGGDGGDSCGATGAELLLVLGLLALRRGSWRRPKE
jgi:hypothetical protein